MALMLFCFIVTMSRTNSSRTGTRPQTELKSWRLTPLKTMRLPLRHMMPSISSKRRKPTACSISPVTAPLSSVTVRRRE